MAYEGPVQAERYEVSCRECDWRADEPVDLKGTANLLAGRHISETGHVVALKTVREDEGDELYRGRGRSVSFEVLRRVADAAPGTAVRACGPVECVVESG